MEPKPPTKPTLDGLERRWADRWARSGVYRFDRTRPRVEVFSIDTPPPTVSGHLHLGHALSYTQTDVRSEERRVGKEWRSGGSPYQTKQKEDSCADLPWRNQ